MAVSHVLLNLGLWSGKKEKEAASMETASSESSICGFFEQSLTYTFVSYSQFCFIPGE